MSLIQRFLLGNRVEDDLQVGLFLKNDGTIWLRNPDGSETQLPGGGGGGFPPAGWTVGVRGDFLLQPTGDGDATIDSLILKAPTDFDSWNPFRITDADDNVLAEFQDDGSLVAAGFSMNDGFGSIALSNQGSPAGSFIDIESGSLILQSPIDNPNSYIAIFRSGGYTAGGIPVYDAWGLKPQGQEYLTGSVPTPDDTDVLTGERWQWYDATSGAPRLLIKERDVDGTLYDRISAVLTADATAFAGISKPTIATSPTAAQIAAALNTLGLVTLT